MNPKEKQPIISEIENYCKNNDYTAKLILEVANTNDKTMLYPLLEQIKEKYIKTSQSYSRALNQIKDFKSESNLLK